MVDTPGSSAATTQPAAQLPGRRRRLGLLVLASMLVLVLAMAGAVAWLGLTPQGLKWALGWVPNIKTEGLQGRLIDGDWQAKSITVIEAGYTVRLTDARMHGFAGWSRQGLHWKALQVRKVAVTTPPPPPQRKPPPSLRLPVPIQIDQVQIDELLIDDLAPVTQLKAQLLAGENAGGQHHIEALSLQWQTLQISGQAHIQADAPFALEAQASLQPTAAQPAKPWQAALTAQGNLTTLEVKAKLQGQASLDERATGQLVALDARATVTPYAKWPLQALDASTQALDLAALHRALPHTLIKGQAQLKSTALDAPAELHLKLENARAGAWSAQQLPVRTALLDIAMTATQRDAMDLRTFDIELGTAAQAAGRWQGAGEWNGHRLTMRTKVQAVQPQRLHAQAPDAQINGSVHFTVQGIPTPSGQPLLPAAPWGVELQTDLQGQHRDLNAPLALNLKGRLSHDEIDLRSLHAGLGAAQADAKVHARALPHGQWHITSQGTLEKFNPVPWMALLPNAELRRGPHQLSGQWQTQLTLAAARGIRLQPLQRLLDSHGQASLEITESLLSGVPFRGQAKLEAPAGQMAQLSLNLLAGGNRLTLSGQASASGGPAVIQTQLDAPQLQALAPWAAWLPAATAQAYWPRQGQLKGEWKLQGQWPAVHTEGQLQATTLALGSAANAIQVQTAQLRWNVDAREPDARLDVQLAMGPSQRAQQRFERLDAAVQGSLQQHRWSARAWVPGTLQADALTWLGLPQRSDGAQFSAQGEGAWLAAVHKWQGVASAVTAGPWDGSANPQATATREWLNAATLPLQLQFSPEGQFQRLQAGAARARLARDLQLVWDDAWFEPNQGQPRGVLKARLEPFDALPMLQRAQPQVGWMGDLKVGAVIDIQALERFDADITLQRTGGDLRLREGNSDQALGLNELRASLAAHNGTWYFTHAFAGQHLGEAAGALTVTTSPTQRWPEATAPLSGVIQARVANLAAWGAWVPPGWRLGGAMTTSASFAGKFGDPEIRGELRGSQLAARNLLQGVDMKDGELSLALVGSKAQIETFRMRAGDGTLTITGQGDLGAKPSAQLLLKAQNFQALGRIDRRLSLSGEAQMQLSREQMVLRGKLKVDDGLFDFSQSNAPSLDEDVRVLAPAWPKAAASAGAASSATLNGSTAPSALARRADLAITLDLGEKLRLRGRGLDTLLRGELQFSNPGGLLALRGKVQAFSGTYVAYGQRMEIARGQVYFEGDVANPRLDVLALRKNVDISVGVNITGYAQRPVIRLYSDPEATEAAKLSWLVLGRAPDGLGNADMSLLQGAALALLAGEGEGVTDRFIKQIGLDTLSVRQSDGDARDTVISLGKQLSDRWYVGYERGVNATTGTWQLIYRIAQRFTLRLQSGQDNAADLIWTWRSTN
jgi:translocation and assembly module TamB